MNENDLPLVVFNDSSKAKVLKLLGLKEEGEFLVDGEGMIQTNQQFEKVNFNEFGGILKGSKIIIKKDSSELVRYFAEIL